MTIVDLLGMTSNSGEASQRLGSKYDQTCQNQSSLTREAEIQEPGLCGEIDRKQNSGSREVSQRIMETSSVCDVMTIAQLKCLGESTFTSNRKILFGTPCSHSGCRSLRFSSSLTLSGTLRHISFMISCARSTPVYGRSGGNYTHANLFSLAYYFMNPVHKVVDDPRRPITIARQSRHDPLAK